VVAQELPTEEAGAPQPLSDAEQEELEELLTGGFNTWNRRDFQAYCRACEKFGRHDVEAGAYTRSL